MCSQGSGPWGMGMAAPTTAALLWCLSIPRAVQRTIHDASRVFPEKVKRNIYYLPTSSHLQAPWHMRECEQLVFYGGGTWG